MTLLRMLVFRPGEGSSVPAKASAAKETPKPFDGNWAALVQRLPLSGGAKELGKVMGQVLPKFKGRVDGKVVNQIVREELQAG